MTFARLTLLFVALVSLAGTPVLATASSGGGPVKGGDYSGTVGPGYPISFHIAANGKAVNELVVAFDETCNGAPGLTAPKFHFATLEIKAGKFSGASTDHFGPTVSDALRISGSFSGEEATGEVTDQSKIKSLHTCTQSEPFIAKLKGARRAATTPPPGPGLWQIAADHSQPTPPIPEFEGAFTVTAGGSAVTGLHGTTEHDVNRGCVEGENVTVLGSVPIRHAVVPTVGSDDYEVSSASNVFYPVKLAFKGRGSKKHPAKLSHANGQLRIFFPGGTDTLGGFTSYSNLTYSSAVAGTCNLEFSISQG